MVPIQTATQPRSGPPVPTTRSQGSGEPTRVLLLEVNEDGTAGGSHQILYDLTRIIDRSRWEPVVMFHQDNVFRQRVEEVGVEVHLFERERDLEKREARASGPIGRLAGRASAVALRRRTLRRLRISLLHFNNSPFWCTDDWGIAAWLEGVPTVASAMGDHPSDHRAFRRLLARRHARILALSAFMRNLMTDAGIPAEKVVVTYPGVDLEALRARVTCPRTAVRSELGVGPEQVLAVMVGNIREWKGQHVVLEALSLLAKEDRRGLTLVFAGAVSGESEAYHQRLVADVERLGLADTVRFLGRREDVPDLLAASDLLVHASIRPEPFGLVVTEGLALGTAVIAARTGGPGEILEDGSGLTFDPERPETLAAAMTELLRDPARRSELARGGPARAETFSARAYVEQVQKVWSQVVKGG